MSFIEFDLALDDIIKCGRRRRIVPFRVEALLRFGSPTFFDTAVFPTAGPRFSGRIRQIFTQIFTPYQSGFAFFTLILSLLR
jgi:hypothetical protein